MGLQVVSSSISSSSASKNVILRKYIGQENITGSLKNIKNCILQREEGNLNFSSIKITDSTNTRGILKQEVQQIRDLKLLSNVSVQSNMAPALTEPLSPANKLSSSASSASPRTISNSQFAVNGNNYLSSSTQNFNGDTKNLIDIETELLRITTKGDINGGNYFCSVSNIGGGVINKTKSVAEIHKNTNIFKGAFQSVFEEVVAKQKEEAAAAESENTTLPKLSIDCISSLSDIKQSKNYKLRQAIEKKTNRFLTIPLKRLNISREKFSRQMGPMCDTNNLAKSQQLKITGGSGDIENQQETDKKAITKNNNYSTSRDSVGGADSGEVPEQQIKVEESEEHMDLSNYDNNEDSQQDNAQVEINSSSSTVTAENTDAEDNTPFPDDIIINNENLPDQHTIVTQESFETLQCTPPLTVTSNVVGSGDTNQQQFLELQQQQFQQSQTVTTTPICSLTPQSTTSIGGLSSQRDFIKDSAEMDQVLGDMDLLQVLKGFDAAPGAENLCDLAGSLGLFNDVDVMNNYEEMGTPVKDSETREIRSEIERRQQQMQRKCDFLLRRLRKIQARYMGRHTSEEVVGLFEWTNRLVRRKGREQNREILYEEDKRRPVSTESMRSFLKRLDTAATSQHSIHCKNSQTTATTATTAPTAPVSAAQTAAFYSGVSNNSSNNITDMPLIISTYDEKTTKDIEHVSGMLQIEMKEVQSGFDSDVTVSSSGGESADEMVTYNNQVQQSLSIAKRAAWRWARDRAAIAARWSWLLAQISDLEYRIRQHNELHHQIKKNKGAVTFEKVTELLAISPSSSSLSPPSLSTSVVIDQQQQLTSVNGYRGTLPGNSKAFDIDANNPPNGVYESNNLPGACRTRPFQRAGFRKRKLLQTANVHTISKKAARPSTIKCGCQWPLHPCALCTGRSDPTAPRDLPDTMKFSERVALLDSGFHAVLSFPEDVSSSIHLEAKMRLPEWQDRVMRSSSSSKNSKGVGITMSPQQKVVERGEDRSSNKKLMDSRRKQNRKYAQDSGQAANKMKNSKARQALLNNQFNNSHPYTKSNSKYRKLSSNAGLISGIGTTSEYQEGVTGSIGTNSSRVTGSLDGGIDGNDYANNHHMPRSKNSSPTHGNHSSTSHRYESRFDRKNRNSYDIDNIVIPYSVAAATRVEILPYKEIPTPKWRIIKDGDLVEQEKVGEDDEHEDISDLAIQIRHERALLEERKKFQTYLKFPWSTRSRANRRIDSRAESSGANTPDPTSPASNATNVVGDQESIPSPANPSTPQTPAESVEGGSDNHATLQNPITTFLNSSHRRGERRRTTSSKKEEQRRSSSPDGRDIIPPFEPLEFPLSDEKYETMLRIMPSNHHLLLEDCSKVNCDQNTDKTDEKSEDYNNDGGEGVCANGINDGSVESESSSSNKREYSTDLSKTTSTATHMKTMVNSDDLLSAFDTCNSLMGCDSDTDSAESGLQDEDPNDPEWREPA